MGARLAGWLLPLLAATWVFGGSVALPRALSDDVAYLCAARAVSRGESPYVCPRYLYPPLLAQLEAAGARLFAEELVQSGVRALNLAASVWLVVYSVSLLALPALPTALVSAVLVVWSPNLRDALFNGNISPLICALLLWGMTRWPARPVASGLAVGVSLALKPLGLAAWCLLALHRAQPDQRAPQRTAAGVALLALAGLSLPGLALLPQMVSRVSGYPTAIHNVSLQRVVYALGTALEPKWQVLAACVLATAYARRVVSSAPELLHLSSAAVLLSQPIVWSHTLLVIYPSLAVAMRRAREAPADPARPRTPEQRRLRILGVALGCLCTLECDMFGDAAALAARPAAALLAAVPLTLAVSFAVCASRSGRAGAAASVM